MEYAQRSVKQFADALATVGTQIPFEEESTLIKVNKQQSSIVETLKRMFPKEPGEEDWRNVIKKEMGELEHGLKS